MDINVSQKMEYQYLKFLWVKYNIKPKKEKYHNNNLFNGFIFIFKSSKKPTKTLNNLIKI